MVCNIFLGLLFFCFFSTAAYAETLQINPNHPDQYTVVEGDTLWDISEKFLQHAWQWPELWRYNRQIHNPHLIYPGDTVYFTTVNGIPQLSVTRAGGFEQTDGTYGTSPCVLKKEDYQGGREHFPVTADGKLMPCIRVMPMQEAIRILPAEQIRVFLSSPRVVGMHDMANAPYVIDVAGEHIIAGVGDKVYVRPSLSPEQKSYVIYRPGKPYLRPVTNEVLGYEAGYVAEAHLIKTGDPSTLAIESSKGDIRMGDRLMPAAAEEFTLQFFPRPPNVPLTGSIISVLGGVSQIGRHNIVVVDLGSNDGIKIGHELDIFRKGEVVRDPYSNIQNDTVKLPDELAGTLLVFRPFERVSYALVMKANQAIHVLDAVKTP